MFAGVTVEKKWKYIIQTIFLDMREWFEMSFQHFDKMFSDRSYSGRKKLFYVSHFRLFLVSKGPNISGYAEKQTYKETDSATLNLPRP